MRGLGCVSIELLPLEHKFESTHRQAIGINVFWPFCMIVKCGRCITPHVTVQVLADTTINLYCNTVSFDAGHL